MKPDAVIIQRGLTVIGQGAAVKELKADIRATGTRDNPAFIEARRMKRWTGKIPPKLHTFRVTSPDGDLVCGRGFLQEARRYADRGVTIVDQRIAPVLAASLTFRGDLRDYQAAAVQAAVQAEQGVIQAPTGSGKTVIGCALMAAVNTPTLFLVHRVELLDQTVQAVRKFLGFDPGVVGNGKFTIRDVTVCMVQSATGDRLKELVDRFGCVILDEAHHAPAASFTTLINKFPARFRFGLTATPSRRDGLHGVLFDVVGPIVSRIDPRKLIKSGAITALEAVQVETGYTGKIPRQAPRGDERPEDASVDFNRLLEQLTRNQSRNAIIVGTVAEMYRGQSLVLTERVDHVTRLVVDLREQMPDLVIRGLTADTPKDERADVVGAFRKGLVGILVATGNLIGEGFDCPAIDTVFLTAPTANPARVKQMIGRALRPAPGKVAGRVVDFVDGIDFLLNQARKRAAIYRAFRPIEQEGELI